jgi:hypothetical protein
MKVSASIDIDAPAEQVWEIIGPGFERVSDWASAIPESRATDAPGPNGAASTGRICTVAATGFDHLTEELTEYQPSAQRLTYRAAQGMPSFVTEARNTWQAEPRPGGGSTFTMQADMQVVGIARLMAPFLRLYLKRIGRRTSHDLKTYAETGSVSRAKTVQVHTSQTTRLDRRVFANAAFSAACGAALTAASGWWSRQLGDPGHAVTTALGVSLIGYATVLARKSGRGVTGDAARVISALDLSWVLGTITVLAAFGTRFSGAGLMATGFTGLVVGTLGWLQWRAANRPDRRATPPGSQEASLSEPSMAAGGRPRPAARGPEPARPTRPQRP